MDVIASFLAGSILGLGLPLALLIVVTDLVGRSLAPLAARRDA